MCIKPGNGGLRGRSYQWLAELPGPMLSMAVCVCACALRVGKGRAEVPPVGQTVRPGNGSESGSARPRHRDRIKVEWKISKAQKKKKKDDALVPPSLSFPDGEIGFSHKNHTNAFTLLTHEEEEERGEG